MNERTRRGFLATLGVTALAGCQSGGNGGAPAGSLGDGTATSTPRPTATPTERSTTGDATEVSGASGAVPTAADRLPLPMSPDELRAAARSGGPRKDGIPSIDDPSFVDAPDVNFLDPGDPVFGVVRDGEAKAYPQKILAQHEIVNDDVAGTSVSVTYCPLTGTAQGFFRDDTTFGVSGRLINNNLVMYDRATEAWWPQILATSIPGPWNETPPIASLQEFRLIWTTWDRWREQNPETTVLSTDTGHAKNYSRDPYGTYNPKGGYYTSDSTLFPVLNDDDRYQIKRVFIGARTADGAAAFLKDSIRSKKVMSGAIGDRAVLAVYDDRYDTAFVYENPEDRSFDYDPEIPEGSVVAADGTSYAADDLPLTSIVCFDAMWFAWAGYYPETTVYE